MVIQVSSLHCVQGKRREGSETAVFYVSFISGFVAGSFAAFCVTPLDGMSMIHRKLLILALFYNIKFRLWIGLENHIC